MARGGRLTGELLNGQNAHIKKVKSIIWCSKDLFTILEDLLDVRCSSYRESPQIINTIIL